MTTTHDELFNVTGHTFQGEKKVDSRCSSAGVSRSGSAHRSRSSTPNSLEPPPHDLRDEKRMGLSPEEMVELRKHDKTVLERSKAMKWVRMVLYVTFMLVRKREMIFYVTFMLVREKEMIFYVTFMLVREREMIFYVTFMLVREKEMMFYVTFMLVREKMMFYVTFMLVRKK